MEIVTGMGGNQIAHVLTNRGKRASVVPQLLRTRGAPVGMFKAGPIRTDFLSWRLLTGDEANRYPRAFGIPADMSCHQVFEFKTGQCIYLVPAIVLIRALLKNNSCLMDAIFRPQSLEMTVTPGFYDGDLTSCQLTMAHATPMNSDFLLWLYAYPSAKTMFHSVFQNSLKGTLGITLPEGQIEVRPRFHATYQFDRFRYVTELCIVSAKTNECPLSFYSPPSNIIRFHRGNGGSQTVLFDDVIPTTAEGRVTLSDPEWLEVGPIVSEGRFKYDPRRLLDGVLQKLSSGRPWRSCSYTEGTWSNASNLYQVLINKGKWPSIIEVLRRHRTNE